MWVLQVIKLISQVIADFANGEISQQQKIFDTSITLEEYMDKNFYKTASLIAASCKSAAVFSGCSEDVKDSMFEYGRHLGLAFQIIDDILDFTQTAEQLGKPQVATWLLPPALVCTILSVLLVISIAPVCFLQLCSLLVLPLSAFYGCALHTPSAESTCSLLIGSWRADVLQGQDLASGNLTAPALFALQSDCGPALQDLIESEFVEEGDLQQAIDLTHRGGGVAAAKRLAREEADMVSQQWVC